MPHRLFSGRLFIGDTYNYRIRLLEDENLFNVAGNGDAGYEDGVDSLAEFKFTRGVVLDAAGEHLYVCDYTNRRIRKITLNYLTGIQSLGITKSIQVYPNPTNGFLQFYNSAEPFPIHINIFDARGEVIFEKLTVGEKEFYVDISGSQPGIYYVRISSTDFVQMVKLILL